MKQKNVEEQSEVDTAAEDTGVVWNEYETTCGVLPTPSALPTTLDSEIAFTHTSLSESWGSCSIVEDLDLDGLPDIALLSVGPPQLRVAYNDGNGGWDFEIHPVTGSQPMISQCTLADLHDDGDWDIVYGTNSALHAFVAEGPRSYRQMTDLFTFPPDLSGALHLVTWLSWMDIDNEGPNDLVIGLMGGAVNVCASEELPVLDASGLSFYTDDFVSGGVICAKGMENGSFVAAPDGMCPSPILASNSPSPWTASMGDLDGDGRADLYIGSTFTTGRLLRGKAEGGLEVVEGSGVEVYSHAMGSVLEDLDGDGIRDLFVTDVGPSELYSSLDCFEFYMNGRASGLHGHTHGTFTWGTVGADMDRNGAVDVFVTNNVKATMLPFYAAVCLGLGGDLERPKNFLLLNEGSGTFDPVTLPSYPPIDSTNPLESQAVAKADLDLDGDIDLVVANVSGQGIWWNESVQMGHWFRARVIDTNGLPAYGARVRLRQVGTEGTERMAELYPGIALNGHSELVADFGLGAHDGSVKLSIRWPDGTETLHGPYAVDQQIEIRR